jgi:hypothetical protein
VAATAAEVAAELDTRLGATDCVATKDADAARLEPSADAPADGAQPTISTTTATILS